MYRERDGCSQICVVTTIALFFMRRGGINISNSGLAEEIQTLLDGGLTRYGVGNVLGIHHNQVEREIRKHGLEHYVAFDEEPAVPSTNIRETGDWILHEDRIELLTSRAFEYGYASLDDLREIWGGDADVPEQYTLMYLRREYGGISGYLIKKKLLRLAESIYRVCSSCGKDCPLTSYTRDSRARHGYFNICAACVIRKNPPDKLLIAASNEKRRARKIGLPSNWRKSDAEGLLRGRPYVMDHFIPLAVGHGGTYVGNMAALSWQANNSKRARNPFEWFEANGQRFELTQTVFDMLVWRLAHQNGLLPEEFRSFTYWCFANKRSVAEIWADNQRFGYKRPSLEIWREAVGLPFPIRVDFGDLMQEYIPKLSAAS